MSKNQEYAERYAVEAMAQMRRHGIPASITLAQGILESSNGQSQLARNENNHFGIKATQSWIKSGGSYALYTDDKPNEKFCSYASVAESYEHHSLFLKNNNRYQNCFSLAPDDYKGWSNEIEKAGYATGSNYASSIIRIIEVNGLEKYDRLVINEMKEQGKPMSIKDNQAIEESCNAKAQNSTNYSTKKSELVSIENQGINNSAYSFPVKRDEYLFVTSTFGMRQDPLDSSKQQIHKGIDIRTNGDDVLATENAGKVISINQNSNTAGGKSITIEYNRDDKSRTQVTYMHLDNISVKTGDRVTAGQRVGVSGNTGTRTTAEHLHFEVKNLSAEGEARDIDPAAYLADIGQKGNIQLQALHNGNDLLTKYKDSDSPEIDTSISPDEWMKKLLSSEDSGIGLSGSDPIMSMITTLYSSLLTLAIQIDNKTEEEQKSEISQSAQKKEVDLKPLLPTMKECKLSIGENGKSTLSTDNGTMRISHELTNTEINRLNLVMNNAELSDESKKMRIAGLINSITLSKQASQNYEEGYAQKESQHQTIQR